MLLRINELLSDPIGFLISFLLMLPGACLAISIHESAHGWVAEKCGDPTARYQGRITLNPIKHFDPVGFLCMLFVGFGWAKPVPVNPLQYKNYRKDDIKVSLAGITANLCLFLVCVIVLFGIFSVFVATLPAYDGDIDFYYDRDAKQWTQAVYANGAQEFEDKFMLHTSDGSYIVCAREDAWQYLDSSTRLYYRGLNSSSKGDITIVTSEDYLVFEADYVAQYFYMYMYVGSYSTILFGTVLSVFVRMIVYCMFINISLAVFNLIPLPPLDGYHVLNDLVLKQDLFAQRRTQQITTMILVGLIMLGNINSDWDIIGKLIGWVEDTVLGGVGSAVSALIKALGII